MKMRDGTLSRAFVVYGSPTVGKTHLYHTLQSMGVCVCDSDDVVEFICTKVFHQKKPWDYWAAIPKDVRHPLEDTIIQFGASLPCIFLTNMVTSGADLAFTRNVEDIVDIWRVQKPETLQRLQSHKWLQGKGPLVPNATLLPKGSFLDINCIPNVELVRFTQEAKK